MGEIRDNSENRDAVLKKLEELDIEYKLFEHEAAQTMQDCEKVARQFSIRGAYCKNLFLSNRSGSAFFLLVCGKDKQFHTADIARQIGSSRLSFGKSERLFSLLGAYPGSVSSLGLMFDKEGQVCLLLDKDLTGEEELCFHPCDNRFTLALKTRDYLDIFLKKIGHMPLLVQMADEGTTR